MSKYISLLKVFLKSTETMKNKNKKSLISLVVLLIIGMLPLVKNIIDIINKGYDALSLINQQGIIVSLGLSFVSVMIFFFGSFYILNSFYFSESIESILYLPLKQSQILGAKFTLVVIYQYIVQGVFALPLIIVYGIKANEGIIYYIYSLIIFLINPIVPLAIASIIVMFIMKFSNVFKNKDRIKTFSGIILFIIILPLTMYIQKLAQKGISPKEFQNLVKGSSGFNLDVISNLFLSSKFASLSLINSKNISGILNLAVFILTNLLFIALFTWVGEKLYFKGVIGISAVSSKRKRLNKKEIEKLSLKKSKLRAYVEKEIKLIFRTPPYVLNGVISGVILPVIFIGSMIFGGDMKDIIPSISGNLYDSGMVSFIFIISLGIFLFLGAMNPLSSTGVSREGSSIYLNKYMPVNYETILMSKVISSFIIEGITTLIWIIPVFIVLKLPITISFSILLISIVTIIFSNLIGTVIDLNFPKLNWDNEQEAIKKNLNPFINLFLSIIIGGIIIYSSYKFNLDSPYTFIYIFSIILILDIVVYFLLKTKGQKLFESIK